MRLCLFQSEAVHVRVDAWKPEPRKLSFSPEPLSGTWVRRDEQVIKQEPDAKELDFLKELEKHVNKWVLSPATVATMRALSPAVTVFWRRDRRPKLRVSKTRPSSKCHLRKRHLRSLPRIILNLESLLQRGHVRRVDIEVRA